MTQTEESPVSEKERRIDALRASITELEKVQRSARLSELNANRERIALARLIGTMFASVTSKGQTATYGLTDEFGIEIDGVILILHADLGGKAYCEISFYRFDRTVAALRAYPGETIRTTVTKDSGSQNYIEIALYARPGDAMAATGDTLE